MTLEQTRQQWYNDQILCLLENKPSKEFYKWFRAYMKAKMEQQLKKGNTYGPSKT